MYSVSDRYKEAIKSNLRQSTIYGTLTINGTEYPLSDDNIIKDSLYITNQIVNSNKLCFGAVYAGECGLTINSDIDRYSLYGAKIVLNYALEVENEEARAITEEIVPLGEFYVDTAERIGSTIKLTAVDNMSKFDKELNEDVNGTLYELLSYISIQCGVELAQTETEIANLHTNASAITYTLRQEHISTYRDALSYLAMVVCSNATIDRFGKLKLVMYATEACDYNDKDTRITNCKFSDYTTRYACITCRFFADEKYATYSVKDDDINGLILDLGDISIVGGTPEGKYDVLNAMLDTLKEIVYVPATLYMASNPAYDLGDMLECRNVNNSADSVYVYIMRYSFEYRKKETFNCYGENPLLQNIKSETQKLASSFENQITSKELTIVNSTNAKELEIKQTAKTTATLNYIFQNNCKPIIICTIPFSLDVDGYVEFVLYDGFVPIENAIYKGYYEKGTHFASFVYLDDYEIGTRRNLNITARAYADTTSTVRVHDAQIRALQNALGVQKNIIDYDVSKWAQGSIDSDTGNEIESTTRIRSDYVEIKGGKTYKFTADGNFNIITRLYKTDKTYRGIYPSAWASSNFEMTAQGDDGYIRFIFAKTGNGAITTSDLGSIAWTCVQVADGDAKVDTTEPTVIIERGAIKAIAYANTSGNRVVEWDGEISFIDIFTDIALHNPSFAEFTANVTNGVQAPTLSGIVEALINTNIPVVRFDGINKVWQVYKTNTWNDVKMLTWDEL